MKIDGSVILDRDITGCFERKIKLCHCIGYGVFKCLDVSVNQPLSPSGTSILLVNPIFLGLKSPPFIFHPMYWSVPYRVPTCFFGHSVFKILLTNEIDVFQPFRRKAYNL